MALKLPLTLKLTHLKAIAFQCGISTSGTKAALTSRLLGEIVPSKPSSNGQKSKIKPGIGETEPVRILSIDMGIRNLAYCVLELPSPTTKPSTSSALPTLIAWRRIAVSSAPIPLSTSNGSPAPVLAKEQFDPPHLSTLAYNLLRNTLLPHNPDTILIERQRFRSMGSPRILEWTVRVNMFESMLYAILHTLRAEGLVQSSVVPIAPGKVGPFWLEGKDGESALIGQAAVGTEEVQKENGSEKRDKKTRNTSNAKLLNKGAKIDLVKRWLENSEHLVLGSPEVKMTAAAYLEKWHRLPGRRKGKNGDKALNKTEAVEEMGKLDDLADCLLQGMAWIQWEKNKKLALKDGIEALDIGPVTPVPTAKKPKKSK